MKIYNYLSMKISDVQGSKNRIDYFFFLWSKLNCNISLNESKKSNITYYDFYSEEVQSLWNQLKEKDHNRIIRIYNIKEDKYINESDMKYISHIILDNMWRDDTHRKQDKYSKELRKQLYEKLKEETGIKNCHFQHMNIYQTHIAYKKLLQWQRDNVIEQILA